jgi:hypothetical protein
MTTVFYIVDSDGDIRGAGYTDRALAEQRLIDLQRSKFGHLWRGAEVQAINIVSRATPLPPIEGGALEVSHVISMACHAYRIRNDWRAYNPRLSALGIELYETDGRLDLRRIGDASQSINRHITQDHD